MHGRRPDGQGVGKGGRPVVPGTWPGTWEGLNPSAVHGGQTFSSGQTFAGPDLQEAVGRRAMLEHRPLSSGHSVPSLSPGVAAEQVTVSPFS
jgi:hypothetical protein